jgi:hypothetical protein
MLLAVGVASGVERRRLRRPEHIVRGILGKVDEARAARALRALSFVSPSGEVLAGGGSPALARLHVARVVADLPADAALGRARRWAFALKRTGALLGVLVAVLVMSNLWAVLEGADLLMARRGVAPIGMQWLDDVEVTVRPPEYLHDKTTMGEPRLGMYVPYGSVLTVRGVATRPGRQLMLSDGNHEVELADDGSATLFGRWSVTENTTVRVVARFGEGAIPERTGIVVTSIPDRAPTVTVEDTPRQVVLVDEVRPLPIRYQAYDDHGLREVHLVLRSGTREERRVLSRLDGETRADSGGYLLNLRDPFLLRSHAAVEVTVEAEDNDPLTGPKWGASLPLTIVPPAIGEPEARCLSAIRDARGALVDSLDWRLGRSIPDADVHRKAFFTEDRERMLADEHVLATALSSTHGGARVPVPLQAMVLAADEALAGAETTATAAPSRAASDTVVRATEHLVLVVDAVVRGLGVRDAVASAGQMADVADDLALGLGEQQSEAADARVRGAAKADASSAVLSRGAAVLGGLGSLGHDLGEIVESDLSRVKRAQGEHDLLHAELAARDLAARLRRPDPSFRAEGSGHPVGGDSGGTGGDDDESNASDDVEQAFGAAQDLERLAQDHAGQLGKTEGAMSAATSAEEQSAALQEARQHAESVREAAKRLPRVGDGSLSWTSKGAEARELAEQMARALDEGHAEDALRSGRSAADALDETERMMERAGWMADPTGERLAAVEDARRKIEAENRWAESQVQQARRRAAERARGELQEGGAEEEKLADRARELAQRGLESGALPHGAVESIGAAEQAAREAADALRRGDGDRGIDRQREAQRNLEQARAQLQGGEEEREEPSGEGAGGTASRGPVDIPQTHQGPDEFRRRVMRGLAQPAGGSIKDAWRRYAEGLLR